MLKVKVISRKDVRSFEMEVNEFIQRSDIAVADIKFEVASVHNANKKIVEVHIALITYTNEH